MSKRTLILLTIVVALSFTQGPTLGLLALANAIVWGIVAYRRNKAKVFSAEEEEYLIPLVIPLYKWNASDFSGDVLVSDNGGETWQTVNVHHPSGERYKDLTLKVRRSYEGPALAGLPLTR